MTDGDRHTGVGECRDRGERIRSRRVDGYLAQGPPGGAKDVLDVLFCRVDQVGGIVGALRSSARNGPSRWLPRID
jgi:hypothetical protein